MQEVFSINNRPSRSFHVGSVQIGGKAPILLQSMCATRTTDIERTLEQISLLEAAGADLIRVAVDSKKDVEALAIIREKTAANLVVDLQENFRLASSVAPYVQKIRYNPGHLHHHQKNLSVRDKVRFLLDVVQEFGCALRIGVNFGSLDPDLSLRDDDRVNRALTSALMHCDMMDEGGFSRYLVSLKSSDPRSVMVVNEEFAKRRPDVPLHLGVTEAGLLPEGEQKTRFALQHLLQKGIGDTIRVSLTLPDKDKDMEVIIGRRIVSDVIAGRRFDNDELRNGKGLNVISCPSCSRVENAAFVELASKVKRAVQFANDAPISIAVMGCRVNGPGETDEADLGLWCGPKQVNLKVGSTVLGQYGYDEVIGVLIEQVKSLIAKSKYAS